MTRSFFRTIPPVHFKVESKEEKLDLLWGSSNPFSMHLRKNIGANTVWNWDETPPAELIESLHLESATIDQHEFSRAEWFWHRRPGILFTNLVVIFSYLTVAVCLFYYLPQTVLLLVAWIGAGVSCVFVDYIRLSRWRNEYASSIKRAIHLSDQK